MNKHPDKKYEHPDLQTQRLQSKVRRIFRVWAVLTVMMTAFVIPAAAADSDPLTIVNNLSPTSFSPASRPSESSFSAGVWCRWA